MLNWVNYKHIHNSCNTGVFGNQELVIDYRGRTKWEPYNCYECNGIFRFLK